MWWKILTCDGTWLWTIGIFIWVIRRPIAPDDNGPWTRIRIPKGWWKES